MFPVFLFVILEKNDFVNALWRILSKSDDKDSNENQPHDCLLLDHLETITVNQMLTMFYCCY